MEVPTCLRFSASSATLPSFSRSLGPFQIPGFAGRVVYEFPWILRAHGLLQRGSRFFQPQLSGAGATPGRQWSFALTTTKNSTSNPSAIPTMEEGAVGRLQWRYDNGLVAGAVPVADSTVRRLTGLTGDRNSRPSFLRKPAADAGRSADHMLVRICSTLISSAKPQAPRNDDHNPPHRSPQSLRRQPRPRQSVPQRPNINGPPTHGINVTTKLPSTTSFYLRR